MTSFDSRPMTYKDSGFPLKFFYIKNWNKNTFTNPRPPMVSFTFHLILRKHPTLDEYSFCQTECRRNIFLSWERCLHGSCTSFFKYWGLPDRKVKNKETREPKSAELHTRFVKRVRGLSVETSMALRSISVRWW